MIFDVSSRAVGCPEQLLDLAPSLSQGERKFIGGEFLRAVRVAGVLFGTDTSRLSPAERTLSGIDSRDRRHSLLLERQENQFS